MIDFGAENQCAKATLRTHCGVSEIHVWDVAMDGLYEIRSTGDCDPLISSDSGPQALGYCALIYGDIPRCNDAAESQRSGLGFLGILDASPAL
jgi:hypothetical protein